MLVMGKFSIIDIPDSRKYWKMAIPSEFRNRENYETFCYMEYMGMDATAMFAEKIKELKI